MQHSVLQGQGRSMSAHRAYIFLECEPKPVSGSHPGPAGSICRLAAICLDHTRTGCQRGAGTRAGLGNSRTLAH